MKPYGRKKFEAVVFLFSCLCLLNMRARASFFGPMPSFPFFSRSGLLKITALAATPVPSAPQQEASSPPNIPRWPEKILLSGTLAGDFRWLKTSAEPARPSQTTSDLYLRMVELGLESTFSDWIETTAVLASEYIGDYLNQGDEKIALDEVHIDINLPQTPFYLVLGKRTQPFGLFENYLVSDPITQDGYETKKVGFSFGLKGPLDSDVGLTLYKGDEQVSHFFQSRLFDAQTIQRNAADFQTASSFIFSAAVSPVKETLTLFGAYLSEPGTGCRNAALNIGLSLTMPGFRNLIWEGEYMKGLSRELYLGASRRFKEEVLSLTLSYRFVLRERKHRGGGSYKGRKSLIRSHPIEVAVRYEFFDDDGLAKTFLTWSTRDRWGLGGRYMFYENGQVFFYAMAEYSLSSFRVPPERTFPERQNALYARLGIDF